MFSKTNKILMSAATIGLLSLTGGAGVAQAQDAAAQLEPQSQQQQAQMNVTDAQLQEFAKAQTELGQIQQEYQARAEGIETQEEFQEMKEQANEDAIAAIQKTELNVQEYGQIASMIQSSPDLQKRYMELSAK